MPGMSGMEVFEQLKVQRLIQPGGQGQQGLAGAGRPQNGDQIHFRVHQQIEGEILLPVAGHDPPHAAALGAVVPGELDDAGVSFHLPDHRLELGVVGAARALFSESPILMTWLSLSVGAFAVFWCFVLRGAVETWRASDAGARLAVWLLVSLPVVWVALRVFTQGEARKRSPIDFALAVFAGIGFAHWRRRSAQRSGFSS